MKLEEISNTFEESGFMKSSRSQALGEGKLKTAVTYQNGCQNHVSVVNEKYICWMKAIRGVGGGVSRNDRL
jgi:hypothetical protein